MSSHRIDGRKLSRKRGPRLALYKNLIVSVLRYERIQTTEAKGKEIRGQQRMITLKRGPAVRRTVVSGSRTAARRDQAFDVIAPDADRQSGSPTCTSASARVMGRDRPVELARA
jgi:large subunit ribosomal protein L17